MKSSLLFAALAITFTTFSLPAQDKAKVSIKIDMVAWGEDIGGLSFGPKKKKKPITARAFKYSDPVNYRGPRILELHKSGNGGMKKNHIPMTEKDKEHESIPLRIEKTTEDAKNQQAPIPKELARRREDEPTLVALIRLPANARRVTILLAPAAHGTYTGYVINDDPRKLPPGKLRVHNLSRHRIAMKFNGGQQKEMDTRDSLIIDAPQGHAIYQLAYLIDDKWKTQENNIIPVLPNEQTQLIVLKSRNRFFLSSDGATGGFLQMVKLRRKAKK
jgi:hypothetical protein